MLKRVLSIFVGVALAFSSVLSVSATDQNETLSNVALSETSTQNENNESNEDIHSKSAKSAYNGIFVEVGNAVLPMPEHLPGTFFTKNGKTCYCHANSNCVSSVDGCNCMRFYPTGRAEDCEIDLLATQCFGFSRLVFYKCFGFIDAPINSDKYHSVGSLAYGNVTESSVKTLLQNAAPGAHIRLSKGHSVSILSMDENGIIVYHANAGGDGILQQDCVVSTRTFTWAGFAEYAYLGINYVNMPNEYPGFSNTDAPEIPENDSPENESPEINLYPVGKYRTIDNLNLRAEPNQNCQIFLTIPNGSDIVITEILGEWGKTSFNGFDGWVCLLYAEYAENPFVLGEDGFLRAVAQNVDYADFISYFNGRIEVSDPLGEKVSSGIIKSGYTAVYPNGTKAKICLAGDIDLNGIVDADDYILAKRVFFGMVTPSEIAVSAGDVGVEPGIDAEDYILLKRFYFTNDKSLFDGFIK